MIARFTNLWWIAKHKEMNQPLSAGFVEMQISGQTVCVGTIDTKSQEMRLLINDVNL